MKNIPLQTGYDYSKLLLLCLQNKMLESRLRDANKRAEEEMVSSDGRIRELQKEVIVFLELISRSLL